jgi:hypothetical protein
MATTKPPRARFHRPSVFFTIGLTSILDLSGTKTYEAFQKALPQSKRGLSPLAASTAQIERAATYVNSLFDTTAQH